MPDNKRLKILFIADHPLVPSGVGTQAKYLIEGLLNTGKYSFFCLGGAMQHPDYRTQKVAPEKFGDNWLIQPVNGYGDKNTVRQFLAREKPDAMFIFTDPRFFYWVWEMEDEIRSVCPLIYWHVWDNDPTPRFNRFFYESTDAIAALSLKTLGLLQDLDYKRCEYIPHSLPADLFKPLPEGEVQKYKREHFGPHAGRKFIAFWNNRNARRKVTGDVIGAFSKFAERVGKDNVALMMHTSVHDPEGQDIFAVAEMYGLDKNLIISESRVPPEELNHFYNAVDCTVNIASNEGFGLATLESLFAGTPILVHMTGGLQFQVGDWWNDLRGDYRDQDRMTELARSKWKKKDGNWWGVPVFPASRSCTGSQQIPYIYDDRVNHEDVAKGLEQLYRMTRDERRTLGLQAREWATRNFGQQMMVESFDRLISETVRKFKESPPQLLRVASI